MTEFRHRTRNSGARRAAKAAVPERAPDDAAAQEPTTEDAVVRRTKDGWRVGSADLPDLTSAMALADLISAELADSGSTEQAQPAGGKVTAAQATGATERPGQAREQGASETSRLRATIAQLEHALTARIRVEQAIGVLAERHRIQPRQAFEQLRDAARSRGRRVIDIASDVVASATNPLLQLPDELSRPRSSARHGRHPRGALGHE